MNYKQKYEELLKACELLQTEYEFLEKQNYELAQKFRQINLKHFLLKKYILDILSEEPIPLN